MDIHQVRASVMGSTSALLVGVLAAGAVAAGATAKPKTKPKPAPPGALDLSFGTRGVAALGRGYQALAVTTQPDGKLVVVGDQVARGGLRLLIARLTSPGKLDRSFNHGRVDLGPTVSTGGSVGRAVAIQPDGKIIVAGLLTDRTGIAQRGMLLERFTSSGALDRRFGSGGMATVLAGTTQTAGNAVALQGNGKIVVAGNGNGSDGYQRLALARLNSHGRLDRSFGAGGVRIADGAQDLGRLGTAAGVALQRGGNIIVAGSASVTNLQVTNAIVARFSSSGNLDRSFGAGGSHVVQGSVLGGAGALFRALSVARDDSIVAAGAAGGANATPAYAIALRLSNGGRPIASFGRGGMVALPSDRGSGALASLPGANAVAFARSGIVVLAGAYRDSGLVEVALWSLSSRGSLLSNGSTRTKLGTLGSGAANGLAIDSLGRIVVAGTSNNFVAFNAFGLRYSGFGS